MDDGFKVSLHSGLNEPGKYSSDLSKQTDTGINSMQVRRRGRLQSTAFAHTAAIQGKNTKTRFSMFPRCVLASVRLSTYTPRLWLLAPWQPKLYTKDDLSGVQKTCKTRTATKCARRQLLQNADGSQPAQALSWSTPVRVLQEVSKTRNRTLRTATQRY